MDKKKVGELDGTPIVTGKKNYANEHEYYLTMNEDNTYRKLEQRVSGDKFRLVLGGGGNDYPTPTAGDVNKVWQVTPVQKGTKTEETVIVPEQTLVNGQELEYNDKFVPGAQCVAVIDGVEYRGEVVEYPEDPSYKFTAGNCAFVYLVDPELENFEFINQTDSPEVTAKLSVIIEETPIYDYNWSPGVKIPIPTAEDEGKILVVTKVEGDNMPTIVPEQEVPADDQTPLTDVDLKYFVPGNTVTATVTIQQTTDEPAKSEDILLKGSESLNSQTLVVSGIIKQEEENVTLVIFNEGQENEFKIAKFPYSPFEPDGPELLNTKSSTDTEYVLLTNLCEIIDSGEGSGNLRSNTIPYATIKLKYGESDYEYQLQENSNSGSGGNTSKGKVVYGGLVDLFDLPCFKPESEWPDEEQLYLTDILTDGYALVHRDSQSEEFIIGNFFIVKVTGSNPSVTTDGLNLVFTDCETVTLDLPRWVVNSFEYVQAIRTIILDDISNPDPIIENFVTLSGIDFPEDGVFNKFARAPLLIGGIFDEINSCVCINTNVAQAASYQN